jgi:hypothetical protein
MNMYGFCRTTDLGKIDFYFSWKNYSSNVYTSFIKVVVLVTKSTAKLVLQFWIFLQFYMDFTAKTLKGVKILFTKRPLESFGCSQLCPWFARNTLERAQTPQCGPRGLGWRGLGKSRRPRRRARPGSGWGGSRGCRGPVWVLTCSRNNVGGRARRSKGDPAAAVVMPVRGRHSWCKERRGEFLPSLGEAPGWLGGLKNNWQGSSAWDAHGAVVAARCQRHCARRRAWLLL